MGCAAAINRQGAPAISRFSDLFSSPLRKPAAPPPLPRPWSSPPGAARRSPRHWLPPWTPQGSVLPASPIQRRIGVFCVLPFFLVFFFSWIISGGLLISPQVPAHAGERVRLRLRVMPRRRLFRRVGLRAAAEAPALPGTRPHRSPLPASYAPRVRAFRWAFPVVIFAILVQSVGAIVAFVSGALSSALRQSMVGGFWMKLCYLGRRNSHMVRDRLISPSLFLVFVG